MTEDSTHVRGILQARDGYRCELIGDKLAVSLRHGTEVVIKQLDVQSDTPRGDLLNAMAAAKELCRFRNAGGSLQTLRGLVELLAGFPDEPLAPLGWRLVTTNRLLDETIHVWYNPQGRALVWIEDVSVEWTTMEQVKEWLERLDADTQTPEL